MRDIDSNALASSIVLALRPRPEQAPTTDRRGLIAALHDELPDGAFVSGQPAQDHRGWVRLQAYIRRLPKLFARVDALEKGDDAKS